MKTIFLILIFLVLGLIFGFILARAIYSFSNFLLRNKIKREALKEDKPFFYQQKLYSLKQEIEFEESKRDKRGFFKKLFNRSQKGVGDYGNTRQSEFRGESVSTDSRGLKQGTESTNSATSTSPTPSPDTTGKQEYPTPADTRGEQRRDINSNLLKKGR